MWQVKEALLYPNVLKRYVHQMGLAIVSTRKVINASIPIKCKQRLEDAIKADKIFSSFYDRWNQISDERL